LLQVRKSLKLPGSPAVAMLHFFSWNATRDKERVRRRPSRTQRRCLPPGSRSLVPVGALLVP
jgi:hypothetical protein